MDEIKVSEYAGGFAFEYWCNGGDLKDIESLLMSFHNILGKNEAIILGMNEAKMQGKNDSGMDSKDADQLKDKVFQDIVRNTEQVVVDPASSIWTMPQSERLALVEKWQEEIGVATLVDQAVELHRRHQQALQHQTQARMDDDTHRFGQQDIIGLTTTACAKYWPLLSKLDMRTVICEEAGEVIEAHSLCTLFPSIKHAIFIGDPLQLRAQVNEQEMALENSKKYRLDQSLFERMMYSSLSNGQSFPTSRLDIQRRAHPVLADIMRATLYPSLEDAPSTKSYPRVAGMAERLYWLDHRHPEVRPDPRSVYVTSYTNTFEADMISAMVRYLVHTNEYNFGDIAVLTPYNGQLEALKQKLQGDCKTYLIEKDKEALMDLRDLDLDAAETIATEDAEGRTTYDMSNMLRLATIDNFQGEEAKIVILSTVRSNIDDRVGFLKSFNRINVACSRAKHGFYIVGNASLMRNVSMWSSIIDLLKKQQKIGANLQACCTRHPTHKYRIQYPEDFSKVPVCEIKCGAILPCGHICKDQCHTHSIHERKSCMQKCAKYHEVCGHKCQKLCGEPCGECDQESGSITLSCGHSQILKCKEKRQGVTPQCQAIVATFQLPCGHSIDQTCSAEYPSTTCQEPCATVLDCGHSCSGLCSDCSARMQHSRCTGQCSQVGDCGHECHNPCHKGACPPCQVICTRSCDHDEEEDKNKSFECSYIPNPCTKPCQSLKGCSAICCLPCTRMASNNPCTQVLGCGHLCPSLEDEKCPATCSQCVTSQPCQYLQIYLPCNHAVDVEKLDAHVGVRTLFQVADSGVIEHPVPAAIKQWEGTLRCPTCGEHIKDIKRYSSVQQLKNLSKHLDELYLMFGQKLNLFMSKIYYTKKDLRGDRKDFVRRLVPGPLGGMTNKNLVQIRGTRTEETEIRLLKFRDNTIVPFEQSMSDLEKFIGHDGLATLLRSSAPKQEDVSQHLVPGDGPSTTQLISAPHTPSPGTRSPVEHVEDAGTPGSDSDNDDEGNYADTAITREIRRQAKEREMEQRKQSSWAVPKKPRAFNQSSKPVPRFISVEGDFDTANLPFKARLESLHYRCRLMVLEEGAHMVQELEKLEPRSRHTEIFLEELRALIVLQTQKKVAELNDSIARCASQNLKRLEVELRLIQISFHSILSTFKTPSGIDLQSTMTAMLALCEQYPDTAGVFQQSCLSVKVAIGKRRQDWNINLYSNGANLFWKKWAGHEVGCLRHCQFGHPYSGYVFKDCPECGRYVEPKRKIQVEEDKTDYSQYLKEDEFVAKMKQMRMGTSTKPPEK